MRARMVAIWLGVLELAGCDGRAHSGGPGRDMPRRFGPTVAVIDLSGGVPEQEGSGLFGGVGRSRSFDELLKVIAEVRDDGPSRGVLVKLGAATVGVARSTEIAEHLEKLKERKPVYCQAEGLTNSTLMITARGCTKTFLSPAGDVEAIGIAAQILYMHRLLAEQLHLSVDFLQIGKFKGAEEPMTRDGPSPEARASLTSVLVDLRKDWLATIQGAANAPSPEVLEDGPYAPPRAKELGLVDEIGYFDDAQTALRAASGAVREQVVFGSSAQERGADLEDLIRSFSGDNGATGPVALVRATGAIAMTSGGNGLFGGRGGIIERDLNRTLRQLERDDDVKVVVLRIDSPGGSALASDLIWHQLMRLRRSKPLVVSVGDMAASGGMYLASAGDFIVAEPMSIVGSIGVVGGKIGAGEALELVGVHAETFPANVTNPGAAARAAYESPFLKWDEPTRERVRATMTSVYELFLSRVADGRSTRGRTMTRDQVAASAEGRIFTGREGQRRGLVDEIGGLDLALTKAREIAHLPHDARVAVMAPRPTILDWLDGNGGAEERLQSAASPASWVARVAPDALSFVSSFAPLAEGEDFVLALPFALTVR